MPKVQTLLRVLTFGAPLLVSAPVFAQPDDVIVTVQDDNIGTVQDNDADDDGTDYGWIGLLGLAGLAGLLRRRDTHDQRNVR